MYHQAAPFSSGGFDSRNTASTAPSTKPITPETTVSESVSQSPLITDGAKKYSANTSHCHCGFDASDHRNCRITKATIAESTQRPQCLTATTLRPASEPCSGEPTVVAASASIVVARRVATASGLPDDVAAAASVVSAASVVVVL